MPQVWEENRILSLLRNQVTVFKEISAGFGQELALTRAERAFGWNEGVWPTFFSLADSTDTAGVPHPCVSCKGGCDAAESARYWPAFPDPSDYSPR